LPPVKPAIRGAVTAIVIKRGKEPAPIENSNIEPEGKIEGVDYETP
jgi:hypothetical protein